MDVEINGPVDQLGIQEAGAEHNPHRLRFEDFASREESVQNGHVDVQDDYVRAYLVGQVNGLPAIPGYPEHPVAETAKIRGEQRRHRPVIVRNDD
jgi:hypothetical protein